FIVFRRWFPDILDTIDATGPAPVCMTVVYLYLVTLLRPTGVLILRVNVHARVGSRLRHDLRLVFKVFELVIGYRAGIKQMSSRSEDHDSTVFNLERLGIFSGLPSVE